MKNNNINKKYVTLNDGGCDFRHMAKIMSNTGYKMNHATARNQLILAIETLMMHASATLKTKIKRNDIKNLLVSQDMHDDLSDVIYIAYKELLEEGSL
jgi:hypothetical protein